MPKFVVDFISRCSIEVEAADTEDAKEKAQEAADLARNEKMLKAQLWENLDVESVSRA